MLVMRIWLTMLVVLASVAGAAPKKPAVVLAGPAPLTKLVGKELAKKYTVRPGTVSAMPTAQEVRAVTLPPGAIALIICETSGQFIKLRVLDGSDGSPLDTVALKGTLKKLPRAIPKPVLAMLITAINTGSAPKKEATPQPEASEGKPALESESEPVTPEPEVLEEPEPPKVTKAPRTETPKPTPALKAKAEPEVAASSPPSEVKPSAHPALRASLGFGGFSRNLSWAANSSPMLATGSQPFSGDISIDASWYPGAHFTSHFVSNLGLFVSGDFGVGMVSKVKDSPSRFAHSASRFRFGFLARLPFGDRFVLSAHLGYARHELSTSAKSVNDESLRPNVPDVLYNGFRGGIGFRLRIVGTLELDGLAGVQAVAGKGELGSERYFPKASAVGIDAGGGLSIELLPHLRLRAGAEWQRYFLTLKADETAPFPAASAADQYITATASLQVVM